MAKKIKTPEYGVYVMGIPQGHIPGGILTVVEFTINGVTVARSRTLGE